MLDLVHTQPCSRTQPFFFSRTTHFPYSFLPHLALQMSVGFGFSIGDFLAAIDLVSTVITALRSSSSASLEYRELIAQLISLENALLQVKRLEFEEGQYAEIIALRQAAAQCQWTIDAFLKKVLKYQPHLSNDGAVTVGGSDRVRGVELKKAWMKIRWAICRKEDVKTFKADLVGHTESIQLLLATVQMYVFLLLISK